MTELQLLGLIALANMQDHTGVNPDDFWSIESDVSGVIENRIAGMKSVLKRLKIEWNGTDRVWPLIVDAMRKECRISKCRAELHIQLIRKERALKVLVNSDQNGSVSPKILEMAVETLCESAIDLESA